MAFSYRICTYALIAALILTVSGCGKSKLSVPSVYSPPASTTSKKSAVSGSYVVWGKKYQTLASADGFIQYGKASWYGHDFHGRKTANGERYDMYGMTAAHKNLPFNTIVRVTNLKNNKAILVRVNDRGPFVDTRVIDLTYTAAKKLDMLGPGVVPVKLEAVGTKGGKKYATSPKKRAVTGSSFYVQVGSFGSKKNALALRKKIMHEGNSCRVFQDVSTSIWKVHVGPYLTYTAAERAKKRLDNTYEDAFVYAK